MSQVDSKDSIVKIEQDNGDQKNGANELGKSAFFVKTEIKTEQESTENRDSDNFFKSLRQFHDNKGTPYYKLPKIGGRDIDLYRLYSVVTSRGGWLKVNNRNEWDKVLHECGFPAKCINANVAVKQIYIRYLDRYEKINFHKEDADDRNDNDEEEDTRHKRWSARSLNSVPMVYNYAQHNVTESARVQHKLSTALLKTSEYDKLLMSLLSPLPNEQDFAINVCTLMANESKPTLKVEKCPKLVDALLAHAGIYNHYTTREIFIEFYQKTRKHSLQSFWNDSLIEKPDILELSYEDYFASNDKLTKRKHEIISKIKELHLCVDDAQDTTSQDDKIISNLDFLCLGRGLGTHDYIGQRVHQIASILRNLSFIDDNLVILAKNKTYLRFLIICSNIHWGNLQHMGLDMLGNIASELELNDIEVEEMSTYLLKTVSEGLDSSDRAVIISCLEILLKLCQKESNEDYLQRYLSKTIYSQVCMYLCLSDIMLLLYTLECIYALSSLGEKACNTICQVRGTIDTLVSLVTVEAQSYGPDACILMRVVETVPGNAVPSQNQLNFNSPTTADSKATLSQMTTVDNTPNVMTPVKNSNTTSGSNTRMTPTITPSQSSPVSNLKQEQMTSKANDRLVQQQTFQENEQFALAWLRATFEPAQTKSNRIEQQDLYKLYMSASSQIGRRGFVSPSHFPKCVRMVFGPTVGPVPIKMDMNGKETTNMFYEGVKIRAQPFPVVHKGAVVTGQVTTQVAESTSAPTPMDTRPPTPQKVVNAVSTPLVQQIQPQIAVQPTVIQQTQSIQQPPVQQHHPTPILHKVLITSNSSSSSTATSQMEESNKMQSGTQLPTHSSLIKSLLANKVTSEGSNQPVATPNSISTTSLIAPNANLHQVAQRQQLKQQQQQLQQQQQPIPMNVALQNNLKAGGGIVSQTIRLPPPLTNTTISKVTDIKIDKSSWDPVPPLAPLSGLNTIRHTQISLPSKIDEDSNSNSISSSVLQNDSESSRTSVADMTESDEDMMSLKDSLYKQSHVVSANKMLADLLEKKSMEPPPCFNAIQIENPLKRKMDGDKEMDSCPTEEKRITIKIEDAEEVVIRPSAKAADLYAELAASMLEDEDLEEDTTTSNTIKLVTNQIKSVPQSTTITLPPSTRLELKKPGTMIQQQVPVTSHIVHSVMQQQAVQSQSNMLHQTTNAQGQQVITVPLQRQIIMSPNNQGQVMLSSQGGHQLSGQMTQTTATIKTETGYQTVPVLLQHSAPTNTIQIQKQLGGQQIMQPMMHQSQNQTQYILTTNQQGQTVVVAQQAPQPQLHQTVLVTQTPQQQGTSAKTIIILQQPQNNSQSQMQQGTIMGTMQGQPTTPQKMIMTTQQGQQVVVTQVPRPLQHHVIMNHGNQQQLVTSSSLMGQNTQQIVIQNQPQLSVANQQFVNTITQSPQIILQHQPQQQQSQQQQMQEKTELIKIGNQIVQVQTQQSAQQQQHINNQQMTIQKQVNSQIIQTQPEVIQTNVNTIQHQNAIQQHVQQQQLVTQQQQHITQQQQHAAQQQQQQHIAQQQQHVAQQQQHVAQQQQQHVAQQQQQHVAQQQQQQHVAQQQQQHIAHQHIIQQQITPQPVVINTVQGAAPQPTIQPTIVQQPAAPPPQPPPPPPKPVEVQQPKVVTPPQPPKIVEDTFDNTWLYVCDWRGCPKRKYKSLMDVYMHACNVHCPDNIDPTADIYCQWGPGPSLCDNLPRKRFSLMTHIFDRHCTTDSFKAAMQRRVSAGSQTQSSSAQMQPVTIIKQPTPASSQPPSEPPTTTANGTITSTAAMHAIKRHALDYVASKELLDENEGPVTKSIRLTAALILRNLVNYTSSAKRSLRYYEPHLAGVALSNVESSRTIAQVLYEMNETHPI